MLPYRAAHQEEKASERAYRRLRQMIVSLKLEPGSLIDEKSLSQHLEIGRTPVREALLRLTDQKLVHVLPRKGTFVTPIRNLDLRAVEELRWHLESLSARWAAERVTDAELIDLRQLLDDAEAGVFAEMPDWDVELDRWLHQRLAAAARNEFLSEHLARLYDHSVRLLYANRSSMAPATEEFPDYRALLVALENHDPFAAEHAMHVHLKASREQIAINFGTNLAHYPDSSTERLTTKA